MFFPILASLTFTESVSSSVLVTTQCVFVARFRNPRPDTPVSLSVALCVLRCLCARDGTGQDFRDPTRSVTCQFDRPVDRRDDLLIFDRPLTGRLTGKIYNI